MNIVVAISIFEDIESEGYTEEQKAIAIRKVLDMPTKNSITKDHICKVLDWLWKQNYILD